MSGQGGRRETAVWGSHTHDQTGNHWTRYVSLGSARPIDPPGERTLCPKISGPHHLYLLHRIRSIWWAGLSLRPTEPRSLVVLMGTLTLRERPGPLGPSGEPRGGPQERTSSAYTRTTVLRSFTDLTGELATSQAEMRHSLCFQDPRTPGRGGAGGRPRAPRAPEVRRREGT